MIGLIIELILWLALAGASIAADAATPPVDDPEHQILVLLQMPPDHFRPGSTYSGTYGDGVRRSGRRRVAEELAREHGLAVANDWPVPVLGVDCYVLNVPLQRVSERDALVQALGRDPRVSWAQAMNVYRAKGHNDPLYAVQPVATAWHLADLHELATGRRVRIAVIDSGIELIHPDLTGQIDLSENFVPERPVAAERHGTEVAGIIAARADNALGIVGVAPNSRLLALRACWQQSANTTLCTSLSLARALDFAIEHDAQIINMSLGGPPDRLLGELLDIARLHGIEVVAAVDQGLPNGGFPASHPGVVAVTEVDNEPGTAGILRAPGRDVPTTGPPSRWYFVSGSSYAAAHVSGLLALMREVNGAGVARSVRATIARLPTGAIDACATLMRDHDPCACACDLAHAAAALPLR